MPTGATARHQKNDPDAGLEGRDHRRHLLTLLRRGSNKATDTYNDRRDGVAAEHAENRGDRSKLSAFNVTAPAAASLR